MEKCLEIYNYLLENCLGYDKRVKGRELREIFDINSDKNLRRHIEIIRQSKNFQYLVGSEAGTKGGYWIVINQDEKILTTNHLYLRAKEQLKTYSILKGKDIYEII